MANRVNRARELGPGVGSAARNTDNAYFVDNGDGTFDQTEAARVYIKVGGVWQAWDGTVSGGGGGGGPATIADGADVAQGSTADASSASTVVGLLKAIKAAVQGTLSVAGSLGRSWTLSSGTDSVNVGNFPGTQPVSLATNTPDVTDRAARLVGHVTVDSAPTTAVTVATVPTHGVTIADGSDVAQGTTTDASSANTVIGILKAIKAAITGTLTTTTSWAAAQHVIVDTAPSTAVTNAGTFAVQSSATLAVDSIGLAKDATFIAAIGSAGDTPSAYTVLDQLTKLRKASEAQLKLLQQLVVLQTPAAPKKTQPTLLHRS